jgi:hypothetical protein
MGIPEASCSSIRRHAISPGTKISANPGHRGVSEVGHVEGHERVADPGRVAEGCLVGQQWYLGRVIVARHDAGDHLDHQRQPVALVGTERQDAAPVGGRRITRRVLLRARASLA